MFENLSKKQKIIFILILSIMILFIFYYIYITIYKDETSYISDSDDISKENLTENLLSDNISNSENSMDNSIIVYICGAVKESKVITLEENSRIQDAIDAVGGLTKEADLTNINLAYILEDGEKIYIPKKGEQLKDTSDSTTNIQDINHSANTNKNNKININKATQTELETIPGIGPSTALKIIDYRNKNGKYNSISDIKNVSGIGDVKYDKIKEYISVK